MKCSYMHILSPNQNPKSYKTLYKTIPSGHRIGTSKLTCLKAYFYYTPTCLFHSVLIPAKDNLFFPVLQDKILDVYLIPSYINHQQILLVFLQRSMKNLFRNVRHHFLLSLLLTSLYKLQPSFIWVITKISQLVFLLHTVPLESIFKQKTTDHF